MLWFDLFNQKKEVSPTITAMDLWRACARPVRRESCQQADGLHVGRCSDFLGGVWQVCVYVRRSVCVCSFAYSCCASFVLCEFPCETSTCAVSFGKGHGVSLQKATDVSHVIGFDVNCLSLSPFSLSLGCRDGGPLSILWREFDAHLLSCLSIRRLRTGGDVRQGQDISP